MRFSKSSGKVLAKVTLKGAVGFSMRAGKCISGDFACEKAVKANKARVVILDAAASEATKERYMGFCSRRGIEYVIMEELGETIGKEGRMVAVVSDIKFANMICNSYKQGNNHGGVC